MQKYKRAKGVSNDQVMFSRYLEEDMSNPRSKLGARIRIWGTVSELLSLSQITLLSVYVYFKIRFKEKTNYE